VQFVPPGNHDGLAERVAQILKVRPTRWLCRRRRRASTTESSLSTRSVHASRAWLEPLPPPSRGCTCVARARIPAAGFREPPAATPRARSYEFPSRPSRAIARVRARFRAGITRRRRCSTLSRSELRTSLDLFGRDATLAAPALLHGPGCRRKHHRAARSVRGAARLYKSAAIAAPDCAKRRRAGSPKRFQCPYHAWNLTRSMAA